MFDTDVLRHAELRNDELLVVLLHPSRSLRIVVQALLLATSHSRGIIVTASGS